MTTDLRAPSTGPGRRTVGEEVSGLIRRREYAEAEAVLRRPADRAPRAGRHRVPRTDVRLGRDRRLGDGRRRPGARQRATAGGHGRRPGPVELQRRRRLRVVGQGPGRRVRVVRRQLTSPFSTATRRQVQQAAADHPAPWTGHRLAGSARDDRRPRPAFPERRPAAQRGGASVGLRPGWSVVRRRRRDAAGWLVAGAAVPPGRRARLARGRSGSRRPRAGGSARHRALAGLGVRAGVTLLRPDPGDRHRGLELLARRPARAGA